MNSKNCLVALIGKYGPEKLCSTSFGEMTLAEVQKHPNYSDGRDDNLEVGLDDEGSLRYKLSNDKTSGPILTLK